MKTITVDGKIAELALGVIPADRIYSLIRHRDGRISKLIVVIEKSKKGRGECQKTFSK